MRYENIVQTIGNTPIVRINKLNPSDTEVYVKLEGFNPGGSVKDRIALSMLDHAEKEWLLKDKIILEPTSGNTGIGLAMISAVRDYRITLVMPASVSVERRKILKAYGADLILTEASLGTDGAIEKAYELSREYPDKYYLVDQFNNEFNIKAHYDTTGKEIWEQTEGEVTMVVACMGTTGTLMGVSKRLKEYNPAIQIIGVEPYLKHKIQGTKNMKEAYTPTIYDKSKLDQKGKVKLIV